MPLVPERWRDDVRGRALPLALGEPLGFLAWYRAARANGWKRRTALAGALRHRR